MNITNMRAWALRHLRELREAREVVECASWWPDRDLVAIELKHRGLDYRVGRWAGWEGDFWVLEVRTGIIFRGTLGYIKEVVRVCSASFYDGQPFRSTALRVTQ